MLFKPGSFPKVRASFQLRADLIKDARLARELAIQMLGADPITLKDMVKIMDDNKRDLLALSSNSDLDLQLLGDRMETFLD